MQFVHALYAHVFSAGHCPATLTDELSTLIRRAFFGINADSVKKPRDIVEHYRDTVAQRDDI